MERRSGGVLERVTDGVADQRGQSALLAQERGEIGLEFGGIARAPVICDRSIPASGGIGLQAEMSVMRGSLWPGLIKAALENLRRQQEERERRDEHGGAHHGPSLGSGRLPPGR